MFEGRLWCLIQPFWGTSVCHIIHDCAGVAKAQINLTSTLCNSQFTNAILNLGNVLDTILLTLSLV